MDDWFSVITAGSELPANAVQQLQDIGFIVIPGPIAPAKLSQLAEAYDAAVLAAHPDDVQRWEHIDARAGLRQSRPGLR